MSFYQDKQIQRFCQFLLFFVILQFLIGFGFFIFQIGSVKKILFLQNGTVATSLLEQGISEHTIAAAITNTETSEEGTAFLAMLGLTENTSARMLPLLSSFLRTTGVLLWIEKMLLGGVLFGGVFLFFHQRKQLYQQILDTIEKYLEGDYSRHLPQINEGMIHQICAVVERLATMLQAKHETEYQTKEFLKATISDISHQLKTPLAALAMYQEIMEEEPDQPDIIREFSAKMGGSISRMEQLIQSMLKLTRLDAKSVRFEKKNCRLSELIADSLDELWIRAKKEGKEIIVTGVAEESLICDREWTSEAIGNIVKNALDYTAFGGKISITWNSSPVMIRIFITDDGEGIAEEDLYHIFKRFYRSKHSVHSQGIGLGLSLAKTIVEGQGGGISVQSKLKQGTTFIISFPVESLIF